MAENKNELDAFERQLKERLDQYEVPYNSADWAQMERALSSGVRGWGHGRAIVAGLLLAGALLIGGTAYYLGRDTGSQLAATPSAATSTVQPAPQAAAPETPADHAPAVQAAAAPSTPQAAAATARVANAKPHQAARPAPPASHQVANAASNEPNRPEAPAPASTSFRASAKEACPGDPVAFIVEHLSEDGIYLWNFGDGSFSNKANPDHSFTKPGTYQVTLSMSSSGAGTIHNKPSSDMIVVHEAPRAAFNVIKRDFAGQVPSVHFDSRAQGAASYHWDLGDGTLSTSPHPDHVYRKKGTYQVVLSVTNETGCVDRTMKEVRIDLDFDLGAPSSFSPNGDGHNDTFMPQALRGLDAKFKLAVYDPAGTLVYGTSDATHPWCGKVQNQGAVVAPGNYVWVVDLGTDQGTETFTGTVQVER